MKHVEILKKYMLRCRNARAQKRLPHRHPAAALLRFFRWQHNFKAPRKRALLWMVQWHDYGSSTIGSQEQ